MTDIPPTRSSYDPPAQPGPTAASDPVSPMPPRPTPPKPKRLKGLWILLVILVLLLGTSFLINVGLVSAVSSGAHRPTMSTTTLRKGRADQTVAVYDVAGVVDRKMVAGFRAFFDDVRRDDNVKAVVLRVQSPGGGVTSSDEIYNMVRRLQKKGKKVVVSMSGLAASGGYYIAAPADEIIAERTTITGSIGVIAGWLVLEGTLDKIGMEPVIIKSTHARGWKDEMSSLRKPAPHELTHLQQVLDDIQDQFEQVVREGRGDKLKTRTVSFQIPAGRPPGATSAPADARMIRHTETEPFNGKIYGARRAMELGLVDSIGYEDDAINRAAKLAGLDKPRALRYAKRAGLLQRLLESRSTPVLGLDAETLRELQTPRIEMIWRIP